MADVSVVSSSPDVVVDGKVVGRLSGTAIDWIKRYDRGEPVKPRSFQVAEPGDEEFDDAWAWYEDD